jgi:hypothetical protein
MATLTGILEWPQRSEGRVRQLNGSTLVQRDDDPFVPQALGERYKLKSGLEVTVTVGGFARRVSRRRNSSRRIDRRRGKDRTDSRLARPGGIRRQQRIGADRGG